MTLANNYAPLSFAADGSTTSFSGSWQMIDATYAYVYLENTTTGVQTLVGQGSGSTEYQIELSSSGFVVTFNTAPVVGNNVLISRSTTPDQTDPYTTSRGFQGGVTEDSFDKLTAIAQENSEIISRNISAPLGDSSTDLVLPIATIRAGQVLGFDSSGNVKIITGLSSVPVSTAMTPVVEAASVSAALSLLSGGNPVISEVITQIFNSSGTYTPTANMAFCIVEAVGGGAGGGGALATSSNQSSAGGGGGAGGYAKSLYMAATIGTSKTVTIGAQGGSSGGNGGNGGTTSFGSLMTANGGTGGGGGGVATTASYAANGGPGGSASGGNIANIQGGAGNAGLVFAAGTVEMAGYGGCNPLSSLATSSQGPGSVGTAGIGYGGGGSGAYVSASTAAKNSGAGANGVIIVTEFVHA